MSFVLIALMLGCGGRDTRTQPTEQKHVLTSATDSQANIPLGLLQLPGDDLLKRTTDSPWESETIGELATSHLKALSDIVVRPDSGHESIAEIISAEFRCNELRPSDLQVAFRDALITVFRPSPKTDSTDVSSTISGPAGLVLALQQLREPFADAAVVRVELKTVRIELDDSTATTTSLVHLFGQSAQTSVQQNMTWDCSWTRMENGELQLGLLQVPEFEEVRAAFNHGPPFVDCTAAAIGSSPYYREILSYGLDHWLDRIEARFGMHTTGWHGLAIGDANGDGRDDVYVCQPGGLPNGLFIQAPDGTAADVAPAAGVDLRDQTHSALMIDIDNDGDQDLVLGTLVGVLIFSNEGDARFTHRATKLTPQGMPFSISASDYDEDGDLDLYVCCYSKRAATVSPQFVGIVGRPIPYHDANNGARNLLLRNNRRWQFTDVTQRVGLGQNNQRFSFAASWEDYDNDGDLDLYVANDYGRNNLYQNQEGKFVDIAASVGVEDISAGMSVSWGDVDNDGWMDLYVSNMFSSAGNRVAYQRQFQSTADDGTRADFQQHARGNSLFHNAGNGSFQDVSTSANVTMGRWSWGAPLLDLNNDGLKDILIANGFITQELPDDL